MFGQLIHELVGPIIPREIPGVKAVHAVDAAGVHPLLLAIGSERYVPYEDPRRPRELLTLANAILGHGQLSLAKYLLIVAGEDTPTLDMQQRARIPPPRVGAGRLAARSAFPDLTTIDTLDYSGHGLNEGSKLVMAAAGPLRRTLPVALDSPHPLAGGPGFGRPHVCLPGILVVQGPPYQPEGNGPDAAVARFCAALNHADPINLFPLIVVVDDSEFASHTLDNFLWTTFTRSNPAADVYGIEPFMVQKHWGCRGSLVIDARSKPQHAPPLVEDPAVTRRVDALGAPGGPLHGII